MQPVALLSCRKNLEFNRPKFHHFMYVVCNLSDYKTNAVFMGSSG